MRFYVEVPAPSVKKSSKFPSREMGFKRGVAIVAISWSPGRNMDGFGDAMDPIQLRCHAASALGRSTLLTSKQPIHCWEGDPGDPGDPGAPGKDYTCCGIDLKPFLPVTLAVSTVIGGICVFILQVPTLCKFPSMPPAVLFWGFSVVFVVYSVALCCMHLSESVTSYVSKYFGIPRQSHFFDVSASSCHGFLRSEADLLKLAMECSPSAMVLRQIWTESRESVQPGQFFGWKLHQRVTCV